MNHFEKIAKFNQCMSMFIQNINQESIVNFLHGYEYAENKDCKFLEALSKHLEENYKIPPDIHGWPGQINRFQASARMYWVDAYLRLSSEVIKQNVTDTK